MGFIQQKIEAHLKDGDSWNDKADFWDLLEELVHRDGWTSNEGDEHALDMFVQHREEEL
jgi:hypothetical protein